MSHTQSTRALATINFHSPDMTALIGCLAAALTFGLAACDSGRDNSDDSSNDRMKMAAGDDESDESSGSDGEVPPTGPESIDHGGITDVPDDPELVKQGEKAFQKKGCTACHKMKKSEVGPALGGVTERREPEWIAKMILNPREMLSKDPTAQKLLQEHGSRMANQNVSVEEARAIIAWLGTQSGE